MPYNRYTKTSTLGIRYASSPVNFDAEFVVTTAGEVAVAFEFVVGSTAGEVAVAFGSSNEDADETVAGPAGDCGAGDGGAGDGVLGGVAGAGAAEAVDEGAG